MSEQQSFAESRMVGEILAAALPGDAHRTDCSTDFLFLLHRQNYHNRALQGLVVPVLPVHKEKRRTVLLLLLLVLLLLLLIAGFSIQLHTTSASQRQDRVPAWSAREMPCCVAGALAWWPTEGTPEQDC